MYSWSSELNWVCKMMTERFYKESFKHSKVCLYQTMLQRTHYLCFFAILIGNFLVFVLDENEKGSYVLPNGPWHYI